MTSTEFNEKYSAYLEEGHYGLDIDIPEVEVGAIKAIILNEIEKLINRTLPLSIADFINRIEGGSDSEIFY